MKISCDAIHSNCCGIYLIRNNINNKVYIGQSVDIKRRAQEHIRSAQPNKYSAKSQRDRNTPIHRAMQKYGIEYFTITILEECSKEELNNKEQYWIKMFNATDKQIGYNLTKGGQNNFALKGEQHSQAKLTQVQVNEIYELLKNSDLSFPEISKKYHISTSSICMINTGKTWYDQNQKYPIRITNSGLKGSKNHQSHFTEEEVMEIRKLYSQGITYKNLPIRLRNKASESAIRAIQYGKTYKHLPIWNSKEQRWIEPCIDYSSGSFK